MSKITYSLMALLAIVYMATPTQEQTEDQTPTTPMSKEYKEKIAKQIQQEREERNRAEAAAPQNNIKFDYDWISEYNLLYIDATIENKNDNTIKDIDVHCYFYSKSGTLLGNSNKKIYDIVPKNSKKVFKKFKIGLIHSQTNTVSCAISNFIYQNRLVYPKK